MIDFIQKCLDRQTEGLPFRYITRQTVEANKKMPVLKKCITEVYILTDKTRLIWSNEQLGKDENELRSKGCEILLSDTINLRKYELEQVPEQS